MKRKYDAVSTYLPDPAHVDLADRRLEGFIRAWAAGPDRLDLRVLIRSAYLQGLADMADVAARQIDSPHVVEMPPQSLEGL